MGIRVEVDVEAREARGRDTKRQLLVPWNQYTLL